MIGRRVLGALLPRLTGAVRTAARRTAAAPLRTSAGAAVPRMQAAVYPRAATTAKLLACSSVAFAALASCVVAESTSVYEQLDELFHAKNHAGALQAAEAALAACGTACSDYELLWRVAKARKLAAQEVAGLSAADKQRLFEGAYSSAAAAVALRPDAWQGHYWAGIALSLAGDFKSTSDQLKNAFVIRQHFDSALALNPKPNGTCYYLLGVWCFTFADMSWVTRKAASLIYATPPSSSYEEALGFFLKAESVEPGFYSRNALMLGKVYLRLGNASEARVWLQRAAGAPVTSVEDGKTRAEALSLL